MAEHDQGTRWERYWSDIDETVVVPWDTDPEGQTRRWCAEVADLVVDGLPLVDLPCGHGRHTWWLADRFAGVVSQVMGVDVSETAVVRARQPPTDRPPAVTVRFAVADILDSDAVAALARQLGPANVWVRFLLHLLPDDDARRRAIAGFAVLAGGRGRIFNYELLRQQPGRMEELLGRQPDLREVFADSAPPAQLDPGRLAELYRAEGFRVVATRRDSDDFVVPGEDSPFDCEWVVVEAATDASPV